MLSGDSWHCAAGSASSPVRRRPAARPDAAAGRSTAGNGKLYIGTYKGEIQIFDEATEKIVGTIPLKTGIPRSLTPSRAIGKRSTCSTRTLEKIEIVDIAARKIDRHVHAEQRDHEDAHAQHRRRIRSTASSSCSRARATKLVRPLGDRPADARPVRPRTEARSRARSRGQKARSARPPTCASRPTASCCTSSATTC